MDTTANKHLLSYQDVLKITENYKFGGKLNDYVIKPFSDEPAGFLAEHYSLKLNIDEMEVKFFIKTIPTNETHLKYVQETRAFFKEIELYKTLFEDMKKAQNRLTLDTRWRPDYYYSVGHELLVLEDLSRTGYKLFQERVVLDEGHLRESVKAMARMHAASFIIEQKNKVNIPEMYSQLIFETEATDVPGHVGNTFYETAFSSVEVLLDYVTGYSENEMIYIRQNFKKEMRRLLQLVKPSDKFKNVVIHGDLWSNNVLFRYNHNNQVNHAIILDYQLGRYAPPAHELQMFLHLTLSRKYRVDNEQDIIQLYYNTLTHELQQYNIDVSTVLPLQEFLDSCQYYQELGALKAVVFFQLILLPPHISSRFLTSVELFKRYFLEDRSGIVLESFLYDKANRRRMMDGLNEVIEKYILKK